MSRNFKYTETMGYNIYESLENQQRKGKTTPKMGKN